MDKEVKHKEVNIIGEYRQKKNYRKQINDLPTFATEEPLVGQEILSK